MKGKKIFLYVTAFFSGMSVMAIELGTQRMLAPYFSSSQIIWTIVIGMIMIAMAIGNIIGGRIADKEEKPNKLFFFMFLSGIWICLIPLVGKFIISIVSVGLALIITKNYLIWASVISCLLVFVAPLLVLGMVTPNLVRFAVNDIADNGKTVGKIEALNTIGSIIGTFLPTFVTIPYIGTALTFVIFGLFLFAIAITYFILNNTKWVVKSIITLICVGIGIASSFIGVAFWNSNIIVEDESIYNYLRVEKDGHDTILSTNVLFGVQSIMTDTDGLTGMYYDRALAANTVAMDDEPLDILILGLGTGTFATQSLKYFDCGKIDGVEIDKKIVDLAYDYFKLPNSVNTYVDDGRSFIMLSKDKYDVIMVDAYRDITIPFQMSTLEFFTLVRDHLTENGVMIVNFNMDSVKENSINDYLSSTIKNVFDSVYLIKCDSNVELIASMNFDVKDKLYHNMSKIDNDLIFNLMYKTYNQLAEYNRTDLLLTDDLAPVEMLGIDVLDEMIRTELPYLKEMFEEKSIKELYEMLINGEI